MKASARTAALLFMMALVVALCATTSRADMPEAEIKKLCKQAGGSYGCCLSYAHHYLPLGAVPVAEGAPCPEDYAPATTAPIRCLQSLQWCLKDPVPAPPNDGNEERAGPSE